MSVYGRITRIERNLIWFGIKKHIYNLQVYKFISTRHDARDIYVLHLNLIHKLIGVTWNGGPYKLIRPPGLINKHISSRHIIIIFIHSFSISRKSFLNS